MTLKLHGHPLSSYCWKALIALYESGAPFEQVMVNLGDPEARAAYLALSPMGKIPVLEDTTSGELVQEVTIIIERLTQIAPGAASLIPTDPATALKVRKLDRLFDLYVHGPMQRLVADTFRPEGEHDRLGVEQARREIDTALGWLSREIDADGPWAMGETFTLVDCAAAPALYYANLTAAFGEKHPLMAAYLARLQSRPSVARVIAEAEPWFGYSPAHKLTWSPL